MVCFQYTILLPLHNKGFMNSIVIRPFQTNDTQELIELFRNAVHTIASRHYNEQQRAVWAPTTIDAAKWENNLANNITFVAEIDSVIVGFADMTHEGYLDHLYVHPHHQARFVSVRLLRAVENAARNLGLAKLTTHCSITAKVPALKMGFVIIKEQTVVRQGIELINYVMEKKL